MLRRFLKFLDELLERKLPREQVGRHALYMSSQASGMDEEADKKNLPRFSYVPMEDMFQHLRHTHYVSVGDAFKEVRLRDMVKAFPGRRFGHGPDARVKHAKRLVQYAEAQWGVDVSPEELLELRGSDEAQELLNTLLSQDSGNNGGG